MIIKNKQKSFTLIELLVVIVTIGILAGVITISTSSSIDKANFAKAQAFSSTVQNELLSNLVSEWTFDEFAINNVTKDSWGNNHGTVYGNPKIKEGNDCVFGGCLEFDGDDYISYGDSSNLSFPNNIFTFSFWVKPVNKTASIGFFGKRGSPWEYSLYTISGTVYFYAWSSGGSSVYGFSSTNYDSNWNYFVWTADGSKSYTYKNETFLGRNNKSTNIMTDTTISFEIGRGGDASGVRYMSGLIDDVRIYNAVMSSSQIKQNYIAGLNSMLANGNISKEDYNERLNVLAYDN